MSKQLALAVSLSVMATVALAVFGVAPAMHAPGATASPAAVSVKAPRLPGLTHLLPDRY